MKTWTKKLLALLLFLALFVMGGQITVGAAAKPAPTVTKKTLYVGYKDYSITMKNVAEEGKVTYSSSDESVAKVTDKGVICPVAAGKATITVEVVQSGKSYKSAIAVTVKKPYVSITNKITTIEAGKTYQFTGKTYGLAGTSMIWGSNNKKVAVVDAKTGLLTAVMEGTVKITFKDKTSGKVSSCKLEVTKPAVASQDDMGDFEIEDGVLKWYKGTKENVVIPDVVTVIGNRAFTEYSSLCSITLPDGLVGIEEYAFYGCSNLGSITIPEGVTNIEAGVFEGCSSLSSITIPKGVTSISTDTFLRCRSLDEITIPGNVEWIYENAFYGCSSLSSVTLLYGVTSIDWGAFGWCDNLRSITIPESVTYIDEDAFIGCDNLEVIYGEKGSYAEEYAKQKKINFKVK